MTEKWHQLKEMITDQSLCQILNALDEGIHIVDRDGRTIFYNQKVSEIDGLQPEEVLGHNLFESYPSLTLETSTLMRTLRNGEVIDNDRQSFINSRGKRITTINRTIPLQLASGETGAMEISRDITQLEELADNLQHLRSNLGARHKKSQRRNSRRSANNTRYIFADIIGENPEFKRVIRDAMKIAGSESSVLLQGETGTGKELFAQSIHNASSRSDRPFIAQNCAGLPRELLEGLLFGTEKGGFTGATTRAGLFEQADGGTILLDEINSMDPALQAKLLRVLQEKKVRRVGGPEIDIDVRVISTINLPPDRAVEENKLREDLFYRLSVVYLEIPPLRQRSDDLPLLISHFIDRYNREFSCSIRGVSSALRAALVDYQWPGNVRELQHVIECAFNMLQNEDVISCQDLPGYIKDRLTGAAAGDGGNRDDRGLTTGQLGRILLSGSPPSLDEVLARIETEFIEQALARTENNISAAARSLGISRQSLQYKLKKYHLK